MKTKMKIKDIVKFAVERLEGDEGHESCIAVNVAADNVRVHAIPYFLCPAVRKWEEFNGVTRVSDGECECEDWPEFWGKFDDEGETSFKDARIKRLKEWAEQNGEDEIEV